MYARYSLINKVREKRSHSLTHNQADLCYVVMGWCFQRTANFPDPFRLLIDKSFPSDDRIDTHASNLTGAAFATAHLSHFYRASSAIHHRGDSISPHRPLRINSTPLFQQRPPPSPPAPWLTSPSQAVPQRLPRPKRWPLRSSGRPTTKSTTQSPPSPSAAPSLSAPSSS